jgi:hypothetical protein
VLQSKNLCLIQNQNRTIELINNSDQSIHNTPRHIMKVPTIGTGGLTKVLNARTMTPSGLDCSQQGKLPVNSQDKDLPEKNSDIMQDGNPNPILQHANTQPHSARICKDNANLSSNKEMNVSINVHNDTKSIILLDCIPDFISQAHPSADDCSVSTLGSADFPPLNKSGSGRSIFREYWKDDSTSPSRVNENSDSSMPHTNSNLDLVHSNISCSPCDGSTSFSRYADAMLSSPDWASYINEEINAPQHRRNQGRKNCSSTNQLKTEYEAFLKANEAGRTVLPSATHLNDGNAAVNATVDALCTNLSSSQIHDSTANLSSYPNAMDPNVNASPSPSKPLKSAANPPPTRRTIFKRRYDPQTRNPPCTLPSYGYISNDQHHPRKNRRSQNQIAFALNSLRGKKFLRSSLRRDRSTSLSEATTLEESFLSSHTRRSVSFERKVTVHEIDKNHEQWVHDGWSERFY